MLSGTADDPVGAAPTLTAAQDGTHIDLTWE